MYFSQTLSSQVGPRLELAPQEQQLFMKMPTRKTSTGGFTARTVKISCSHQKAGLHSVSRAAAHQEELNKQHTQGSTYHRLLLQVLLPMRSRG